MHHHTTPVPDGDLQFNRENRAIDAGELSKLLSDHGLHGLVRPPTLSLYRCAFVHSSYVLRKNHTFEQGNHRCPPDCLPLQEMAYERLEFLGDAVLGCVCAEYLYRRFPAESEGFLTRVRTGIVNGVALADIAAQMGLERHIILSRQEEAGGGRENPKIMEDVFEALVGAILTDTGSYDACRAFLVSVFETYVDWAEIIQQKPHAKEQLAKQVPKGVKYLEVDVSARSGRRTVTVAAKAPDGTLLGTGKGPTRRLAERAAALAALDHLGEKNKG